MDRVRGNNRAYTGTDGKIDRWTDKLRAAGEEGQVSDVTSDVDKTGLNNKGCCEFCVLV